MTRRLFALIAVVAFGFVLLPSSAVADACAAVKREMAFGEAAAEDAKDAAGFKKAAEQFKDAVAKAPECATAFYNLGVVQEKANEFAQAKYAFERYLKLAPNAADRASVEKKIFKLEYRSGEAAKASQDDGRIKEALASGVWCWENQFKTYGRNCSQRRPNSGLANIRLTVNGDNFRMVIDWQNGSSATYAGTLNGPALKGKYSIAHREWAALNCANLVDFTGLVSDDGRRIVMRKRQHRRLQHCRVMEWGPQENLAFVRIR